MDGAKFAIGILLLLGGEQAIGDITEISPMNFGTVVIASNSSPETIALGYTGSVGYSAGIYPVTSPSVAEFQLFNYPANQLLFISANSIQANSNSDIFSTEQFTLPHVDVPSVLTTDGSGAVTLFVGGTLQTSGSGSSSFIDTRYRINYQVTVNY